MAAGNTNSNIAKKLTNFGKGMGWQLFWSPDSKKIAFINYVQEISVLTVATGDIAVIDKTAYAAL